MLALHAPDAVISDRRAVGFGEFAGHDAIRAYYEGLFDNTDALSEELDVVHDADGVLVAAGVAKVVLTGQDEPETFNYALRFTFDGERIATVDIYENAAAAVSA